MNLKEYRKIQQECRKIEQEWLDSIEAPVKRVPKKVAEAIFERLFVEVMQAQAREISNDPPQVIKPVQYKPMDEGYNRLQKHLQRKQTQYDREILRESLEMEMVNASMIMQAQEMIEGVNEEYRHGFEDANRLNEKRLHDIDKIAEETQKRLERIDETDAMDTSAGAGPDN